MQRGTSKGLGLDFRLTGREQGMAAKRPVLAVAMVTTVAAVGFFALRGPRGADDPVITRAAGDSPAVPTVPVPGDDDGNADSTLVSADRPSPDSPRPPEIAAIVDGSVVVLDGRDGTTVRTLATHTQATTGGFPYLQGVTRTPDQRDVYYALAGDCGPSTIYRVAADGHAGPTALLSGVSPAVSPDGRKLAYAVSSPLAAAAPPPATAPPAEVHGDAGLRQCQNAVVVRDLATGAERTWRYPDTPDFDVALYRDAVITEIDWAPDSTQLAYTLSYEGDTISVLDTAVDADLGETDEVVIPGGGGNSSHPAWQAGSGRLAVFNTRFECCFDDNYTGPPRVLLVDVERRLAEPLLPDGRRVTALDFDLSGAHLLFVDGGRLYRRSGSQSPVRLAAGITSADW